LPVFHTLRVGRIAIAALAAALIVGGCAPRGHVGAGGIDDPYEKINRKTHAFNRGIDRAFVRPAGTGYASVVPDDIQDSVGNLADNLGGPQLVVNNLLQGDLPGALKNTYRFVINTTLGFGGLFDVAADFGVEEVDTDFGATLAKWGVREGVYVELPLLGPSTERDAFGKVVDIFTDPLGYALPNPEKYYPYGAKAADMLGKRGRHAELVDSILYDSADSYAQGRMIYLQNRRYNLGASAEDLYSDPYATGTVADDPYMDPYADPYSE